MAPPPLPLRAHTPSRHDRKGGDFYLATSEDLYLATSGDFFMATDKGTYARRLLHQWLDGTSE